MRTGPAVAALVLLAISVFPFGAVAVVPGATTADPAAEPAGRCPTGPTEETRERAAELNAGEEPPIAGLYPDPTSDGNAGEFLVLSVPDPSVLADHKWTITDDHTTAALPNETEAGRVALSIDPDRAETITARPVAELEGHLQLSADGDDLAVALGRGVVAVGAVRRYVPFGAPERREIDRGTGSDREEDPGSGVGPPAEQPVGSDRSGDEGKRNEVGGK